MTDARASTCRKPEWSGPVGDLLQASLEARNAMATRLARAAEYVRMSTEHQRYSTENQSEAIHEYAARHGIAIVRTYADEGKSGLRLDGRDALKRLRDHAMTLFVARDGSRPFDTLASA